MKAKIFFTFTAFIFITTIMQSVFAQCSICTKTAEQLGEGPAHSLNKGILYLMFTPLAIMAYIGVKWWRKEKEVMKSDLGSGK